MTFLIKDPDSRLDYGVDWGTEYLGADVLVGSNWLIEPDEPSGVTIAASAFDSTVAEVTVTGGIAGNVYRLSNHVLLSSGLSDSRSIVLRVEKR